MKAKETQEPRTTDTPRLNHQFFAAQIQIPIPIPNKYMEEWLSFCKNNDGKHGQGIHSTKMGVLPKIPQNLSAQAQKFGISMKKGFIGRP